MKKLFSLSLSVVMCCIFCLSALAQTEKSRVLTNSAITYLVRVKNYSPALIKSKIEQMPCNFSTSDDSLDVMRKNGVSDDILAAMVTKAGSATTATATIPKSQWGTFIKEGKKYVSYITGTGKLIKIGDTIQLGPGHSIVNTYQAIHVALGHSHASWNANGDPMGDGHTSHLFVVEAFDAAGAFLSGKHGAKTAYLYISEGQGIMSKFTYEVSIEDALAINELRLLN